MATRTDGWPGRYIWELVLEASRLCVLELADQNIFKPVIDGEQIKPLRLDHFLAAEKNILKGVDIKNFRKQDRLLQNFLFQKRGELGFSIA